MKWILEWIREDGDIVTARELRTAGRGRLTPGGSGDGQTGTILAICLPLIVVVGLCAWFLNDRLRRRPRRAEYTIDVEEGGQAQEGDPRSSATGHRASEGGRQGNRRASRNSIADGSTGGLFWAKSDDQYFDLSLEINCQTSTGQLCISPLRDQPGEFSGDLTIDDEPPYQVDATLGNHGKRMEITACRPGAEPIVFDLQVEGGKMNGVFTKEGSMGQVEMSWSDSSSIVVEANTRHKPVLLLLFHVLRRYEFRIYSNYILTGNIFISLDPFSLFAIISAG